MNDPIGPDAVLAILGTLAAGLGALSAVALLSNHFLRKRGFQSDGVTPLPTLAGKLGTLSRIGSQAASLANEIEQEIAAQVARAQKAISDQRDAEAMAKLSEEERRAVENVVREQIIEGSKIAERAGRWKRFWANFAYFAAGVIASVIVTLFVHPIGT